MSVVKKLKHITQMVIHRDPFLLKRIQRNLHEGLMRVLTYPLKPSGVSLLQEDWDYLIILDACRFDIFEEENFIPGKLFKKHSLGTGTPEWLRENFRERRENLIYVTANPWFAKIFTRPYPFHHTKLISAGKGSKKIPTIHPTRVTRAALDLLTRFPNKRFIIHYLQPHIPYISPKIKSPKLKKAAPVILRQVLYGDIKIKKVKTAYRKNLRFVLKEIEANLIPHLQGKVVISSDHGEAFGEKGILFHPFGVYIKELTEIPWLEINQDAF